MSFSFSILLALIFFVILSIALSKYINLSVKDTLKSMHCLNFASISEFYQHLLEDFLRCALTFLYSFFGLFSIVNKFCEAEPSVGLLILALISDSLSGSMFVLGRKVASDFLERLLRLHFM